LRSPSSASAIRDSATQFEESIAVSEVQIAAEPRTEFGKGAARRTRRAGKIPAVLYGHGQDPRHISLPAREFGLAIRAGGNTLLSVSLNGRNELALPKQIQRDPVKGTIEHVDLILVRRGEKVHVQVPLLLTGEVVTDGLLNQELNTLELEADATNLPDSVEIDIAGLAIGAQLRAGDVKLPDNVTLVTEPDHMIVSVLAAPSAAQVEAQLAEAEAEAGIEHDAPEAPAAAEPEPAEVS
jgi:large subunit ribosomal protein L25